MIILKIQRPVIFLLFFITFFKVYIILGEPFLKKYYTGYNFENNLIYIAEAVH